jgi:hypothetical protein
VVVLITVKLGNIFLNNGKDCIFIGLDLNLINFNKKDIKDITKSVDEYIFSISFEKKYLKQELSIDRDYFDDDEWIYIPLNRKYLLEDNKTDLLKTDIINIINEVFLKNVA